MSCSCCQSNTPDGRIEFRNQHYPARGTSLAIVFVGLMLLVVNAETALAFQDMIVPQPVEVSAQSYDAVDDYSVSPDQAVYGDEPVREYPEQPYPDESLIAPGQATESYVQSYAQDSAPVVQNPASFQGVQPQWFGYSSPVRVSVHGGENFAEPGEFASLDIMKPIRNWRFQGGSEQIVYLDARVGLNFESGGLLNLGLGRRHYFAGRNAIFDANIWYDVDGTRNRLFHQVTAGAQVQGERLLMRGNYYLPFADTQKSAGHTSLTGNAAYQGNALALERFRKEQQAYQGYDVEIGWTLPTPKFARLLMGYYKFYADDAEDIQGLSATVTAEIFPALLLSLQGNFGDDSQDNLLLTATYDLYQRRSSVDGSIRHRMAEPVGRTHHIVSRETLVYNPLAATDATGANINVIHVSSAGNSTGRFESPYANLAQAAADAAATPNSIILVHADSVFDGQSIVLPNDTRFLGETVSHTVATSQLGNVTLPRATMGTTPGIIRNSSAATPAITLANNVEVNGVGIESAAGVGVFGTGLTGGTSLLNTTVNGAATGVQLVNGSGTFAASTVAISNTTQAGLHLQNNTGTSTFTDVTVTNAGTAGIHVESDSGTNTFDGLTVDGAGGSGIDLQGGATAQTVQFDNQTTIQNTGQHGLLVRDQVSGSVLTVNGPLEVTTTGGDGIRFEGNSDTTVTSFNGTTTISGATGNGIFVSNQDTVANPFESDIQFVGDVAVTDTTLSGLRLLNNGSNVSFGTLQVSDWNASAISVDGGNGNLIVTSPLTLNNINASPQATIGIANSAGDITFGDVTITDTARTVLGDPTVNLVENNTGVDEIVFQTLNIESVNAVALSATQTGTNFTTLEIGGGTIRSVGASAIDLTDTSTVVTLQSVSAANAAVGIHLNGVGTATAFHEHFRVVGDGTIPGAGGTITNVQRGVVVDGSRDVALNYLTIDSTVSGVELNSVGFDQPEDATVNGLTLTDAGGTNNWVGIDVAWGNGAHISDLTTLTSNVITGSGSGQTGIRVSNDRSNPSMGIAIGGNTINLTGATSDGIALSSNGFATGTLGDINLRSTINNIVNATQNNFVTTTTNGGQITGQMRVNGALVP